MGTPFVWIVWYGPEQRTTITSFDEWKALPDGIQGVVEYEREKAPDGSLLRVIVTGVDWYVWHEGHVVSGGGGMPTGTWVDKPSGCEQCIKKSGATVPDDVWGKIRQDIWDRKWPT